MPSNSKRIFQQTDKDDSREKSLPTFTFILLYSTTFFRIGFQLVSTAWQAINITAHPSSIGYALLISSITGLLFSPIIGKFIDSLRNKKRIVFFGNVGVAISGIIPFISNLIYASPDKFYVLAMAIVFLTISGLFATGPMDYFVKQCIPTSLRSKKLASINMATQIALISGTGLAGVVISAMHFDAAFLVVSVCGVISAIFCSALLPKLLDVGPEKSDRVNDLFVFGPRIYFKYPQLFYVACCAALVFSVGQITNTLLPALIDIYLKRTSLSYSLAEAAWSIGAFFISAFMAGRGGNSMVGRTVHDLLLISAMAVVLAIIPFLTSFSALLAMHFFLGVAFAFVRIRSEARFLDICPAPFLGRARANSTFLTSLVGLSVFVTPIIFNSLSIPFLYYLFAGVVLASSAAVFLFLKESRINMNVDVIH
jgi:MFS family permease